MSTAESDDMDKVLTSYFDKTVNSNTIKEKPTPSSELSKGDLLKILSYLEGEVQARDVVIATLKCERVKRLLADNKYTLTSDPFSALKRDSFATFVNSSDSKEDVELVRLWENQILSLENLVRRQRQAMKHMNKILADAEAIHRVMANELEDEKAKNVISKDGAKLKEELEVEKQLRARLESELKETQDAQEEEKSRHKNIVLLLLTERKRILRQFIEERKRSADLSAMLDDEKRQALGMAEGLEEESQKALRMEAELERQASSFRAERDRLESMVAVEEERRLDTESQLKSLRVEVESLRKQLAEAHSVAMFQASLNNSSNTVVKKNPLQSNVVRPTATVTSVPVPQPTTGIAKSVSPVQPAPVSPNATVSNSVLQAKPPSGEKNSGIGGGSLVAPKKYSLGRGVPPPVPPNKPSVPPKSGTLTAKIHAAKLEQQIT
ncbi:unnamed protein product [Allacma fusca]|uniref:Cortactin-binding protein-2 N-terminal domain-containing protein n=1 Tax=Allacma fusca TaxID=39272 RepID=A0A8J2K3T5_9HEXA|nr:unnamed protein product [Allacma fusca]